MKTSSREIFDILKAWLAISIAFNIATNGFSNTPKFYIGLLISAVTAGIGFIAHELSHKYLAQKYGCKAEFISFDLMLILAVLISFTGVVFAAPGGVFFSGTKDIQKIGKISAAGIVASMSIAALFLIISLVITSGIIHSAALYGLLINSWLSVFNLIPIGPIDGKKIWQWSKGYFAMLFIISMLLLVLGFSLYL